VGGGGEVGAEELRHALVTINSKVMEEKTNPRLRQSEVERAKSRMSGADL
jgi:hypothetical protein